MKEPIKPDQDPYRGQLGLKFNIPFYNDTLPMMIWDFDTLNILGVNERAVEMYGYSREEFLQMTILDLKLKEEVEDVRVVIENITEKEKYHPLGIYNHIKKDKSHIKIEISGYEITYQDKDCILIVCNDVTENEENLQKIRENEQNLFNGKQQLSLIYNNVKDIVFLIDVEENTKFKFASVNRSFINSTGLSENDTIGKYVTDVIPEPSLSVVIGKYNEAIKKKTKITWEETTDYPTGTKVGIVTINPVFDSEGNCTQLIGSVQDITERKKEERQLKLLESVITNATDSVMITEAEPFDEPGPRILYVNNAFTKMTGYTAEEVIGKTPRILQGPKSDSAELNRLGVAIRKWEFCEITIINYKKNGQEFWVNFSVTPVANETGWYTHWIAIERDVTEKIKAEQKLQALYKERNAILESIGDAFFAVDSNWIVTYWNNMAEKVLKTPKDKILDKNLWEVFSESIGSESYKKYHEALETKQSVRFEDYYLPLDKWYEICAYPSNGGLSVYFKDITDNKSYTNAIQEQNKKLREISWMQSHLVRAPLARIMALAPLIAEPKQSDNERIEMLQFLTISANELDAVIKDITEKSKIIDS